MKFLRLIALVLALVLALGLPAYGQAVNVTANKIRGSATAPSGPCSAQQVQLTTAGVIWVCGSGSWVISGGGGSLTATRVGFGSGANALTGSADFTYADATGVLDLTKTGLNSSVRMTVANASAGTAAQARFGASADLSGAALIAYSSTFTTSGLRTANSAVLDLDGTSSVLLGQAGGSIKLGLGTTEYGSLTTTAFNLFGPTAGSVTGLSVTSAAAGSGVTVGVTGAGNNNLILAATGTGNTVALVGGFQTTIGQRGIGFGTTPNANYNGISSGGAIILVPASGDDVRLSGGTSAANYRPLTWYNDSPSPLVGLAAFASGQLRLTNGTTGGGQFLIGTNTDTADAQLSVYSQSTTRPSLKLNMPSGTSATQEAFGNYNNGTRTAWLSAAGDFTVPVSGSYIFSGGTRLTTSGGADGSFKIQNNATGTILLLDADGLSLRGGDGYGLLFGASQDTRVYRDGAANTLAQRNGTNAQTFRIYETYTDGSNYERIEINASATTNTIKPAAAGTGTASKIDYYLTPTVFMTSGTGSPEGVITAGIGSTYHRTDGGAGTSFYVKESGTGNTGWIAK